MTKEGLIKKWFNEQERLLQKMQFCSEHNMPHERDFLYERYSAINDVLIDIRFDLEEKED